MNKDIISLENSTFLDQLDHQSLLQENNLLKSENFDLKLSLEKAQEKVRWFEAQFKLSRQRQFDRKTENMKQLELPINIFNGEESAAAIAAAVKTDIVTYIRNKKEKKGRNVDTSLLPRATIIHDLSENEKNCGNCQHHLEKIGEDKSEQLEIIQEPLFVVEHIRYKYVCRHCDQIKMANKVPSPIAKSMASASLLTTVIINKYQNHWLSSILCC